MPQLYLVRPMRALLTIIILLSLIGAAVADGIPMKNGHFVGVKTFIVRLTPDQVKELEKRRSGKAQLYEEKIVLTSDQVDEIQRHAKKRITRLEIFEGNWKDCACHAYNIGSRIDKTAVEVPVPYLFTETEIAKRFGELEPEVRGALRVSR